MAGFILVDNCRGMAPIVARKSHSRELGQMETSAKVQEALKGLVKAVTSEHQPKIKRGPKYPTLDSLPAGMSTQIEAMLEQNQSIDSLSRLFDTSKKVIEDIFDRITSPQVVPPAPKPAPKPKSAVKEISVEAPYVVQEPEAYLEEPAKPKPRVLISHASLRDRFRKLCKKSHKGNHWHFNNWRPTSTFSVDGKALLAREAAYILYKGTLPPNTTPMVKCGLYDCVSPDCLIVVPEKIAKTLKKPTAELIREIRRLSALGKGTEEIVHIMGRKVDPGTVYKVERDLAYWNVQ